MIEKNTLIGCELFKVLYHFRKTSIYILNIYTLQVQSFSFSLRRSIFGPHNSGSESMGPNSISFQFVKFPLSEKWNRDLSLWWWCWGLCSWQFIIYFHSLYASKESRNYVFSLCCTAQFLGNNLLWRIKFYLFFSWEICFIKQEFPPQTVSLNFASLFISAFICIHFGLCW